MSQSLSPAEMKCVNANGSRTTSVKEACPDEELRRGLGGQWANLIVSSPNQLVPTGDKMIRLCPDAFCSSGLPRCWLSRTKSGTRARRRPTSRRAKGRFVRIVRPATDSKVREVVALISPPEFSITAQLTPTSYRTSRMGSTGQRCPGCSIPRTVFGRSLHIFGH